MVAGGQHELRLAKRRTAEGSDLAVRPGLVRDPVQRGHAVVRCVAPRLQLSLRACGAAQILDQDRVAALGEEKRRVQALAMPHPVVGLTHQNGGQRCRDALGTIEAGAELHAVGRGDAHAMVDLDAVPPRRQGNAPRRRKPSHQDRARGRDARGDREEQAECEQRQHRRAHHRESGARNSPSSPATNASMRRRKFACIAMTVAVWSIPGR